MTPVWLGLEHNPGSTLSPHQWASLWRPFEFLQGRRLWDSVGHAVSLPRAKFHDWNTEQIPAALRQQKHGSMQSTNAHCSQQMPEEWKQTPNSPQASDCDIVAEIWATRDLLPPLPVLQCCASRLGHHDKKAACEPLSLPTQLNVDADKLAGDYMAAHPNKDCTGVPILTTSGVQLHLPAEAITYDTKKEVNMARTEPMKQCAIKKCRWEEATFLDIEREAHRRATNRHHKQRTMLNKRLGNFLPIGKVVLRCDPSSVGLTSPHAAVESGLAQRLFPMFTCAQQKAIGGNSSCLVCTRSWTRWTQR